MPDCTYCGCTVGAQEGTTIAVHEGDDAEPAGVFCNYGCLASHVDDEGLAEGTSCAVSFD